MSLGPFGHVPHDSATGTMYLCGICDTTMCASSLGIPDHALAALGTFPSEVHQNCINRKPGRVPIHVHVSNSMRQTGQGGIDMHSCGAAPPVTTVRCALNVACAG